MKKKKEVRKIIRVTFFNMLGMYRLIIVYLNMSGNNVVVYFFKTSCFTRLYLFSKFKILLQKVFF